MEDNLEEIVRIIASETDYTTVRKIFEELFTPKELVSVSKRWYLMKALYKGRAQRKIAKDMEISLCKITRGSKILKDPDSVIKKILDERYNG